MKRITVNLSALIIALCFCLSSSAFALSGSCSSGDYVSPAPACGAEDQTATDANAAVEEASQTLNDLAAEVDSKLDAWFEAANIVDDAFVGWQDLLVNQDANFAELEEQIFISTCTNALQVLYAGLFTEEQIASLCEQYHANPSTFHYSYPAFGFEPLSLIPEIAEEQAEAQITEGINLAETTYNASLDIREGLLHDTIEENGVSGYYELWASCDDPKLNLFIAEQAAAAADAALDSCQAAAADATPASSNISSDCALTSTVAASTSLMMR